ncbi:MAG: Ig-like domain-containing protein, partial [Spirochaetales bacterium]|nr:Ig-like domain-containing protein [Spirochaetales bacterium]
MKILRRFRSGLYIIGLIAVLLLASCPNPLLTGIEEAVEVVVTPPEVKAVYPAANSSNIPTNLEVITVTFSKPIRSASVTTGTFLVKDTDGAAVSGTFEITNDTIKFKPNSGVLKYETTYTITATGKILDIDGNPLPAAFSWTFTTGLSPDEEAPYDIIVSIDNDAQWATSDDVAVQIQAKDNRGIAQINITDLGQTSFSAEGWTTFEAVYDEESSIYTSTVDWSFSGADGERTLWVKLKDGAGNTTVTAASDSISVDTQKPEINFVRLNGGISSTMSDTYTLDVSAKDEGSGVVQFRYRTGDGATAGAWSAWFDLTDGESNGNLVTFSVGQDETEWVDVQAIDVAGNISDIATEAISYDLTRPVISDKNFTHFSLANPVYYPFNGTVITIQFNEDMRESSVTDSTFEILEITLNTLKKYEYYVVDVKDLVTQVDGETVTLPNRVAEISGFELEPNNSYTINLSSTVTDLAGNELGSDYSWTISTGDSTDSDPPTGSIGLDATSPGLVAVLPTGASATNDPSIVLAIDATDRYNTVVGMKIWGDSGDPGTYPAFEQDAVWEPVTATKLWSLSSASFGTRYILYKFIDAAGNASPAPLPL